MGITKQQLKNLGFKNKKFLGFITTNDNLEWKSKDGLFEFILPEGKTVIFIKRKTYIPLIHLDFVGYHEMKDFLYEVNSGKNAELKQQINSIIDDVV